MTLTLQLSPEIERGLDDLARDAGLTKDRLAAEAISAYVAHESALRHAIRGGLQDVEAGLTLSHRDAMKEIEAIINASEEARDM